MILVITLPLLIFASGLWSPWRWHSYINVMQEVAPINFYGQVVDEQNQPIVGARVQVRISKPNWKNIFLFRIVGDKPLVKEYYDFRTDALGRFQIAGEYGREVAVEQISSPRFTFEFNGPNVFYYAGPGASAGNAHIPDPDNPVLFQMIPIAQEK